MKIESNGVILDLLNSVNTEQLVLEPAMLLIDKDNIEGDKASAPLILFRLNLAKSNLEHELSILEMELNTAFYQKSRDRRVNKALLPNSRGGIEKMYPTNNQQVAEIVYSDSDYKEKQLRVINKKHELSVFNSFYFSYQKKVEYYAKR